MSILFKNIKYSRDKSTSAFLFRPTALVKQIDPVKCVSEEDALLAFFAFLESAGPRVVLVGLDEETVDVLLQKLEDQQRAKFRSLVVGYTWWKSILNNTNITQK